MLEWALLSTSALTPYFLNEMKENNMKTSITNALWSGGILSVLFLGGGCASMTSVAVESKGVMKPISMTPNINREYIVIKHFKKEQKAPFLFLTRLNPAGAAFNLDEELRNEPGFGEGDAVVNVSVKSQLAMGDLLFPLVVGVGGGLIFPPFFAFLACPLYEDLKTCVVEGDIVKYAAEAPAPGGEKIAPTVEKPTPVVEKLPAKPIQRIDPETGLPMKEPSIQFDPNTGLPIKPE